MATRKMFALEIGQFFDKIQSVPVEQQKAEIESYNKLTPAYRMFLQWYYNTDLSKISEHLNYRQCAGGNGVSSLISKIRILNGIPTMPPKLQVRTLETIFESINVEDMMVLENALTHTLEDCYPNIDWDVMRSCMGIRNA